MITTLDWYIICLGPNLRKDSLVLVMTLRILLNTPENINCVARCSEDLLSYAVFVLKTALNDYPLS